MTKTCDHCSSEFETRYKQQRHCGETCRNRVHGLRRRFPCASCGKPMYRGPGSLGPGRSICRDCRRRAAAFAREHQAVGAARRTLIRQAMKKRTRRWPAGSTTARGYGWEHQQARAAAQAAFVEGSPCPRCEEPMLSTQPLDLDHRDDRDGYLGLAHRSCNRGALHRAVVAMLTCPICGTPFPASRRTRTCGRACGWELRRRAA